MFNFRARFACFSASSLYPCKSKSCAYTYACKVVHPLNIMHIFGVIRTALSVIGMYMAYYVCATTGKYTRLPHVHIHTRDRVIGMFVVLYQSVCL